MILESPLVLNTSRNESSEAASRSGRMKFINDYSSASQLEFNKVYDASTFIDVPLIPEGCFVKGFLSTRAAISIDSSSRLDSAGNRNS